MPSWFSLIFINKSLIFIIFNITYMRPSIYVCKFAFATNNDIQMISADFWWDQACIKATQITHWNVSVLTIHVIYFEIYCCRRSNKPNAWKWCKFSKNFRWQHFSSVSTYFKNIYELNIRRNNIIMKNVIDANDFNFYNVIFGIDVIKFP